MHKQNLVYKPISSLIPYINNARTHSDDQVNKIAASIKEFGFNNPILLDKDGVIIAGHGRLMAAKKLGLEQVPTIELSHLSEAQKKAYILADNRMALDASWDSELLKLELEGLQELDFDLSLTGFSDTEIAYYFGDNDQQLDANNLEDKTEFLIVVNCIYEIEQKKLYEELAKRGYECKLMM